MKPDDSVYRFIKKISTKVQRPLPLLPAKLKDCSSVWNISSLKNQDIVVLRAVW